jgi:hypothetical protein
MAKVGRFVTEPGAGAYCQIKLDNGETFIVNHDKGGLKGGHITMERKKWWGGGERFFECDLDSPEGRAAFARVSEGATAGSADATPLGAFVNAVRNATSIEDARAHCEALLDRERRVS